MRKTRETEFFALKRKVMDIIVAHEASLETRKHSTSTVTYISPIQALDDTISELEEIRTHIRNVFLFEK